MKKILFVMNTMGRAGAERAPARFDQKPSKRRI